MSLARKIKAKMGCQAIKTTRLQLKSKGEFIPCNGMQGNFRHRCVAGLFLWLLSFGRQKKVTRSKAEGGMQNVKEKMRKVKVGAAVNFGIARCKENIQKVVLTQRSAMFATSRFFATFSRGKENRFIMRALKILLKQNLERSPTVCLSNGRPTI